jgi:hypothetical protein
MSLAEGALQAETLNARWQAESAEANAPHTCYRQRNSEW